MSDSKLEERIILSLASSEREATVALTAEKRVLASIRFNDWLGQFPKDQQLGRSSALVSMIKEAMAESSVDGETLDAIALTHGPGRFTGLRVSVVTARMLCYAWNVPVVAANSLEVAANKLAFARSLSPNSTIWALTDAQRRQVFAAKFRVTDNGELGTVEPQSLFERDEILEQLDSTDHVTGSGAFAFKEQIEEKVASPLPDPALAECDAIGVSSLALAKVADGKFDDPLRIEPVYFRPSAAEEIRLAKNSTDS